VKTMSRTERNFWLDIAIFITLLTTTITGIFLWLVISHDLSVVFLGFSRTAWIAAHAYSGVIGLGGIVLHIDWHWVWLKAMRGRALKEMTPKLRANRVVDRIMWIVFITTNIFGAISWIIYYLSDNYVVNGADRLHVVSGLIWVFLAIAHLCLHWKWILSANRRHLSSKLPGLIPLTNDKLS